MGPQESAAVRLVADIGGTHARFALAVDGALSDLRVLDCADFADPGAMVETYLEGIDGPRPRVAVLAVASPLTGDDIRLTNLPWRFSAQALRARLGMERLEFLNDFTALALALPHLNARDLRPVGGGNPDPRAARALLGAGTGLGVSGLIPAGNGWAPITGEGGHVTLCAADGREAELLGLLRERFGHVSAERVLSGPGLGNLFDALARLRGCGDTAPAPESIVRAALDGSSPLCVEVLETFCALLGNVAGNLALTLGARGGLYIGGAVVPALGEWFASSPFRARFEAKGRFCSYLADIPCYVITAEHPALIGLARR